MKRSHSTKGVGKKLPPPLKIPIEVLYYLGSKNAEFNLTEYKVEFSYEKEDKLPFLPGNSVKVPLNYTLAALSRFLSPVEFGMVLACVEDDMRVLRSLRNWDFVLDIADDFHTFWLGLIKRIKDEGFDFNDEKISGVLQKLKRGESFKKKFLEFVRPFQTRRKDELIDDQRNEIMRLKLLLDKERSKSEKRYSPTYPTKSESGTSLMDEVDKGNDHYKTPEPTTEEDTPVEESSESEEEKPRRKKRRTRVYTSDEESSADEENLYRGLGPDEPKPIDLWTVCQEEKKPTEVLPGNSKQAINSVRDAWQEIWEDEVLAGTRVPKDLEELNAAENRDFEFRKSLLQRSEMTDPIINDEDGDEQPISDGNDNPSA